MERRPKETIMPGNPDYDRIVERHVHEYLKSMTETGQKPLIMDNEGLAAMSTPSMTMLGACLCENPASPLFGHLTGFFRKGDAAYNFMYRVHNPGNGRDREDDAMLSWDMLICERRRYGAEETKDGKPFVLEDATTREDIPRMGAMAVWEDTPDDCLEGDDLNMRAFIRGITAYAHAQNWHATLDDMGKEGK